MQNITYCITWPAIEAARSMYNLELQTEENLLDIIEIHTRPQNTAYINAVVALAARLELGRKYLRRKRPQLQLIQGGKQ